MKPKKISILTFFCLISVSAWSQAKWNYGPELGISFSQMPQNELLNLESEKVFVKDVPLLGSLIGFNGILIINPKFQLGAGLHYQSTGRRYHNKREGLVSQSSNNLQEYAYTTEFVMNQTFHKIGVPITAAYTFKMGKIPLSIFGGIRRNIFINGDHYSKTVVDATRDEYDYYKEEHYNPFSSRQAGTPSKRVRDQIRVGCSAVLAKQFKFSFIYHTGRALEYSKSEPVYKGGNKTYFHHNELQLSLTYLLLKSPNR